MDLDKIEHNLKRFGRSPYCDSDEGDAYLRDVKGLLAHVQELEAHVRELEKHAEKSKKAIATLQLQLDAWKGEVRNILYDRPRALGASSKQVIAGLNAELAARQAKREEAEDGAVTYETAYAEGQAAFCADKVQTDNPYPMGTPAGGGWFCGFDEQARRAEDQASQENS